eukprot:13097208-Ditylum_brightwellii.AAC.1
MGDDGAFDVDDMPNVEGDKETATNATRKQQMEDKREIKKRKRKQGKSAGTVKAKNGGTSAHK